MDLALATLALLVSAALLMLAGARLVRYGEAIASTTGLSAGWVGLFLVASVTSLPELFSGAGSILIVGSPDLAVGDVLGSCAFNLVLVAVVMASARAPFSVHESRSQRVVAGHSLLLLGVAGVGIAAPLLGAPRVVAGISSAALVPLYFIAVRHAFTAQVREPRATHLERHERRRAYASYTLAALGVVASAIVLPTLVARVGSAMGLTLATSGAFVLAFATSLPEMVVTWSAVRARAHALAVGGLLGSNLFDLVIVPVDDLLYARSALLADVSPSMLVLVAGVAAMTFAAWRGLRGGAGRAPWVLVVALYVLLAVLTRAMQPILS